MICGSGGSKNRLAKAAGAEPSGQMRDEQIAHCCGAKQNLKSKCTKRTNLEALWKVEMSKKCRPLWREAQLEVNFTKSKCTKHTMLRTLLEVHMSKKCTLLWREAHFEVKLHKAHHARSTFNTYRKSARRCGAKHFSKSKVQKTDG